MPRRESQFLQELFRRAAELVQTRLEAFDPQELRLYSKTLTKFAQSLTDAPRATKARDAFVHSLQKELRNAAKFPNARPLMYLQRVSKLSLTAFGSTVMGTGLKQGDIDISLNGVYQIRHSGVQLPLESIKKRELHARLLHDMLKFLRWRDRVHGAAPAIVLSRAKVPILKYTDRRSGYQCDISIGNDTGVIRSRVLGEIIQRDPLMRLMVLLVKRWARAQDLNDASRGSFGSYPLTVLVLAFSAEQGQLPSLKNFRSFLDLSLKIPELDSCCEELNQALDEERSDQRPEKTLVELMLSFLACFSLFCSREALYDGLAPHVALCGGGDLVKDLPSGAGRRGGVFIRDLFDLERNCAKPVTSAMLQKGAKQLENQLLDISAFLEAPLTERRQRWQILFQSLFGTALKFKSNPDAPLEIPHSERHPQICLELWDGLIQHYSKRDSKRPPKLRRAAHCPMFLKKFDALVEGAPSKEEASSGALFKVNDVPVAIPVP